MYFRKSYNNLSKGSIVRKPKNTVSFEADTVWAAACAAQRINGDYVKMVTSYATNEEILPNSLQTPSKQTNRMIMDRLLANQSEITEADREQGQAVRSYYKGLTFKILQGKKLSDFDNTALALANRDVIESNYDIAVMASLPSCYERNVKRDNQNRKLELASGGFVGKVGDKVKATIEVIRSTFSQQWNTFFVSGVTTDDQAVFFSFRDSIEAGKVINIYGTVKRHGDNITQLNRVKVM